MSPASHEGPRVLRGLLGWANKRTGLEFYRWDERVIPRHESEWGDLLVYDPALRDQEGATVIVVVLPRRSTEADIVEIEQRLRQPPTQGGES